MTERISIFNYEAFYLDFLEGNLNEEDTVLLLKFLDKHPDLKVALDDLESLTLEEANTDLYSFKASLKKSDIQSDIINTENFEDFSIAALEGQLNKEKTEEFNALIAANPALEKEWSVTQKLVFEPDTNVVYPEKEALKRKKAIVLWPYFVAAASILIAFMIINSSYNKELPVDQQIVEQPTQLPNSTKKASKVVIPVNDQEKQVATNTGSEVMTNQGSQSNYSTKTKANKQPIKNENYQLAMNVSRGYSLPELKNDDEVEIIEIIQSQNSATNEDNATAAVADLKSVARPITSRLSNFTNTPIDVKTAKATNEKPGGFLFKIGKVEVSRVAKK